MATSRSLTPEQVKAQFRARGITITQWAEEHGYRRNAVYRVLNGFDKAHYGQAHEIAVKLGIKSASPDSMAAKTCPRITKQGGQHAHHTR